VHPEESWSIGPGLLALVGCRQCTAFEYPSTEAMRLLPATIRVQQQFGFTSKKMVVQTAKNVAFGSKHRSVTNSEQWS